MNAQDFANLVTGNIKLYRMYPWGSFKYPWSFCKRWNRNRTKLRWLAKQTRKALAEKTELEKEQWRYTK